jgi:hypothetical protein
MNPAAQSSSRRFRGPVVDYALYVAIAFAVVGAAFVVLSKWGDEAYIRWGGLAGFTAVLFGYFIQKSRQYFRDRRFWILTAAFLAVHLAAFAVVLIHVDEWKLIWFTGTALEYPVFAFFRERLN